MTPEFQPRRQPSWQIRIAQVVAVVIIVIVGFVLLTSLAKKLADGISNESNAVATIAAGSEVEVEIPVGSTARTISTLLAESGVIVDAGAFEQAVKQRGAADKLKAGMYTLTAGTDTSELIDTLVKGPPPADVYLVTVIEGLTINETLASLAGQTPYTVAELKAPLLDGTVDSPYLPEKAPAGEDDIIRWEGLLAPDTYEFLANASAATIVGRLADTLAKRVEATDWSALEARGLTPYDGLIIASLIEKEAKLDEERPTIASVIVNRLDRGMALQIDATIIYALGENQGQVTLADLQVDSPYNTYLNPGLPPTPIGGVRPASLAAAAAPADTEYLYYVLVDKDGTHGFSKTLEEHNRKKAEAKANGVLTP